MNWTFFFILLFIVYEFIKLIHAGNYLIFKSTTLNEVDNQDKTIFSIAVIIWGLFRLFYILTLMYYIKISDNFILYTILLILQIIYGKISSSFLQLCSFTTRTLYERVYSAFMVLFLMFLFVLEI